MILDSLPKGEACAEACPGLIAEALEVIRGKWAVPILLALFLSDAPMRYADLQRGLKLITPKELARHLRSFEARGLVQRRVFPTNPPKVDYTLTDSGRDLYPSLEKLGGWAANR